MGRFIVIYLVLQCGRPGPGLGYPSGMRLFSVLYCRPQTAWAGCLLQRYKGSSHNTNNALSGMTPTRHHEGQIPTLP